MKKIINSVKMGVKAALTPWEIAAPDWADTNGEMGKWINMDATFKVRADVCLFLYTVTQLSQTLVVMTWIWMFYSSCTAALLILPISHRPKQNWADRGTAKIKGNPTIQVGHRLCHPVVFVYFFYQVC